MQPVLAEKKQTGSRAALCAVGLLSVAALSGCSSWLGLEDLPRPDDAFSASLAEEYAAFAQVQIQAYDWWNARHFAAKSRQAAAGKPVRPEAPEDYPVPNAQKPALDAAHQQLLATLTHSVEVRFPVEAARAQALFDCWLLGQSEAVAEAEIASCRDGFYTAMEELEAGLLTAEGVAVTEAVPMMVYFAPGSDRLNAEGVRTIAEAAGLARQRQGPVTLMGYTDTTGSAERNQRLSKARVSTVQGALMAIGLDESRIVSVFRGETGAAVEDGDAVPSARARRVEIYVEPGA